MKSFIRRLGVVVMILTMGFSWGCMGGGVFGNRVVDGKNRIRISPGTDEVLGVWTTGDLSLAYGYVFKGESLKIKGNITLANRIKNFTVMENLRLRVNFVDSEGRVTGGRNVYTSPYREEISMLRLAFNRELRVPPGSTAMAFSYGGRVGEGGGGGDEGVFNGGDAWEFWKLP